MNQQQCNELRDQLFAVRSPVEPDRRLLRYVAVLPGRDELGAVEAVVHYAFAPASWEGVEAVEGSEAYLRQALSGSKLAALASDRLLFRWHDYLREGWPLPWELTAKASTENFPLLVLLERGDGSVTGSLMRDPQLGAFEVGLADQWCEPGEVAKLVSQLRLLEPNEPCLSVYKEANVDASALDAALASTPESDAGQKRVLVYRDSEWLSGVWTNPASSGVHGLALDLYSVSDFHFVRASNAKRSRRQGLHVARAAQVMAGDYGVLEEALKLLGPEDAGESEDPEKNPGLRLLCDWWNSHAPHDMRYAGLFRVYFWEEASVIFVAGDPDEPVLEAHQLARSPAYALFEAPGRVPVAVQFFRGREFNTPAPEGTHTYYANGQKAWTIGQDPHEVNEAWYSLAGMHSLRKALDGFRYGGFDGGFNAGGEAF